MSDYELQIDGKSFGLRWDKPTPPTHADIEGIVSQYRAKQQTSVTAPPSSPKPSKSRASVQPPKQSADEARYDAFVNRPDPAWNNALTVYRHQFLKDPNDKSDPNLLLQKIQGIPGGAARLDALNKLAPNFSEVGKAAILQQAMENRGPTGATIGAEPPPAPPNKLQRAMGAADRVLSAQKDALEAAVQPLEFEIRRRTGALVKTGDPRIDEQTDYAEQERVSKLPFGKRMAALHGQPANALAQPMKQASNQQSAKRLSPVGQAGDALINLAGELLVDPLSWETAGLGTVLKGVGAAAKEGSVVARAAKAAPRIVSGAFATSQLSSGVPQIYEGVKNKDIAQTTQGVVSTVLGSLAALHGTLPERAAFRKATEVIQDAAETPADLVASPEPTRAATPAGTADAVLPEKPAAKPPTAALPPPEPERTVGRYIPKPGVPLSPEDAARVEAHNKALEERRTFSIVPKEGETAVPKPQTDVISTRGANADVRQDLLDAGLKEYPPAVQKKMRDSMAEAQRTGAATPERALATAQSILEKPRPFTDVEQGANTIARQHIKEGVRGTLAQLEKAQEAGDANQVAVLKAQLKAQESVHQTLADANERGGTEAGRAFALRQQEVFDYDYLGTRRRMVAADPTKPVTPAEDGRVTALTKQLEDTNKAIADRDERIKDLQAQALSTKVSRQAKADAAATGRTAAKGDLTARYDDLVRQIAAKSGQLNIGVDPSVAPLLKELFKIKVQQGILSAKDVIDQIHADTRGALPDAEARDIRDAITGYGEPPKTTRGTLARQMSDLRKQMLLVSKIEDAQSGVQPAQGRRPGKPSADVQALREQLDAAMKSSGLSTPRDPLPAIKTRLQRQIADLEEQLKSGVVPAKSGRTKPAYDTDATGLVEQRNRLQDAIDRMVQAREKPTAFDYLLALQRNFMISRIGTLGKLGAAATARIVVTPVEEIIGAGLGRLPVLKRIAAKAPREGGGVNLAAERDALKATFGAIAKGTTGDISVPNIAADTKAIGKTGKGSLDAIFGSDKVRGANMPAGFQLLGSLHQALKNPALRNEFFRSLQKRSAFAQRQGLDISDPATQMTLGVQAYNDANRMIFKGSNKGVDMFRRAVGAIGSVEGVGPVAATAMQTALPIVKIPVNYAGETYTRIPGVGFITPKMWEAAKAAKAGGIDSLSPEQADEVFRTFKRQGLSAALFALGAFGAIKAGGYYQKGRTPKEGEPGFSEIQVGGANIPHTYLHAPAIESIQMGATYTRYMQENAQHSGDDALSKVGNVAGGIGFGIAEQVPFYEELTTAGRAGESEGAFGRAAGAYVSTITEPGILQEATTGKVPLQGLLPRPLKGDVDDQGKTIARSPRGFREQIKMGVPVLRQQVPQRTQKRRGRR